MHKLAIDSDKLNALLTRALGDLGGAYGSYLMNVGHRLGLFKAMAGAGPLTSREVASRAGCAERYVREWLNAQAAAGYVDYHAVSATYELSPEQALVLADEESTLFFPPVCDVPASFWLDEEKTLDAFRTGKGIAWGDHHQRLHKGVASFYRNGYRANLVDSWLPALDGVVDKLHEGIDVADVGCGYGHSTVLMAEAFPKSRFFGFDVHEPSIAEAQRNAAGLSNATFNAVRTGGYLAGGFGLICFFDCLHDMGDPVAVLREAAEALAPGGTILAVEPFANDRVEDNLNEVGRLYYGGSTMLCTAHALSEGGTHVLGAQAGEAALREIFRKAGFRHFRRAAETPFNLILEAR